MMLCLAILLGFQVTGGNLESKREAKAELG